LDGKIKKLRLLSDLQYHITNEGGKLQIFATNTTTRAESFVPPLFFKDAGKEIQDKSLFENEDGTKNIVFFDKDQEQAYYIGHGLEL
jgi:hypothetical protein